MRVVAEITPTALERAERREIALVGAMTRVAVAPMDAAATLAVVTARAAHWRRAEPRRPQVATAALAIAVELARRYLPYRWFPGKAVALLDELRAAADGEVGPDGAPRELGADAVYDGFASATGVPAFLLRDDRALLVADVIAQLGRRMIGQERAVARVAETLCTVKAQLQPADKPLATFLFVGPTGVGKTELAKSLAHLLFGSEGRLVRFDMSEYADPWAAERLIRGSDAGEGLLTARIRQQPFAVVLLDEIEKAHPAVHDLLLQVAGEGRLTDARGRTAFFHNAIVILTSNLGAHGRGGAMGLALGGVVDERDRELARYRAAVTEAFRPEMLNRLDAIIPFHRLDAAQIAAVTRLALAQLAERRGLVQAQLTLDVSDAATAALAEGGYAPAYGVRALRRHLDQAVIAPAARLVARLGRDAHGALLAVRTVDEPIGVELPAGAHLGTTPPEAGVTVSAWRRGGAGGRRNARGALAVAAARRAADGWMRRDLATEVKAQLDWLKAQLARGEAQPGGKRRGKAVLSSAQVQQMAIELARLERAWDDAGRARDDLAAAEELAIAAALAGDDVEPAVAMVAPLERTFARAMFWLAVARREQRDEITLGLSATDHPRALGHWVTALLAEAERRGWTITAHSTVARDPAPNWPIARVWGPPRTRAWLAGQTGPDGGLRNALVRVRGPGAACLLGLEAGAHRYFGIAKESPCHLVVRRLALATEFTDAEWLKLATLAPPAATPRGPVEREHPDDASVIVRGTKLALPWVEQWARLEEVALTVIAAELAAGRTADELYPVELVDDDDAGDDDGGDA
ncbi:MAG: ATP-dependent Clp protease ATP-binding subunit [Myxococcales bacterium]|nr:ATP-dependent Clp protease ATP-binding subunit [Myxococcales bacterium]